jgi:hypothetical protein
VLAWWPAPGTAYIGKNATEVIVHSRAARSCARGMMQSGPTQRRDATSFNFAMAVRAMARYGWRVTYRIILEWTDR